MTFKRIGRRTEKQGVILCLGFGVFFCVAGLSYWPGINGPYLLDDFIHLPKIQGETSYSFWSYVSMGATTPGRFLSYLSFLIEDNAWPTPASGFKRTNILLHLLNGVLVFTLFRLINRAFGMVKSDWLPLVAAFLWVVHPMQVSTTLYVIQRMTILSSMAMLLACICFCVGRLRLAKSPVLGYIVMTLGLAFFGLLGLGFKETAVVLLLYVCVLEYFVFGSTPVASIKWHRAWFGGIIVLPVAIVLAYFVLNTSMLIDMASQRSWTIGERLLTEGRIVMDYIGNIIAPQVSDLSLFHDDYPVSTGLFEPVTTFFSIFAVFALLVSAVIFKKRYPLFSFAVVWYFAGHMLESTALPLELYFEHRNYLPLAGYCYWVCAFLFTNNLGLKKIAPLLVGAYLGLMLLLNFFSVQYWSSWERLAAVWVEENPGSGRARYNLLQYHLTSGNLGQAEATIASMRKDFPDKLNWELFDIYIRRCAGLDFNEQKRAELVNRLNSAEFDLGVILSMNLLRGVVFEPTCERVINERAYLSMVTALLTNPNFENYSRGKGMLYYAKAEVLLTMGELNEGMVMLEKVSEYSGNMEVLAQAAKFYAMMGDYDAAYEKITELELFRPRNVIAYKHKWLLLEDIRTQVEAIKQIREKSEFSDASDE